MAKQDRKNKRKGKLSQSSYRLVVKDNSELIKKVDSFFKQAEQYRRDGKYTEAEKTYRSILELKPNHVPSLIHLANKELEAGNMSLAFNYANDAVKANHASANAHAVLGKVLSRGGFADHAESELMIALQLDSQNCDILDSLGYVYTQQGRFDEANKLFRQSIAIQPDNIFPYCSLAVSKRFARGDVDLDLVLKLYDLIDSRDIRDQILIHFSLGKVLHDCGEYDRAFEEYKKGNQLKDKQLDFNGKDNEEKVNAIIDIQSQSWMKQHKSIGCSSEGTIFIVGMPRSGTTLLESLLCRHPQISGIGEPPYINNLVNSCSQKSLKSLDFPEVLTELKADDYKEFGETYIKWSRKKGVGTTHTVDKTPVNFLYLGFILAILPNAKLVHNYRDPVDTCLSIYQQLFAIGSSYAYNLKNIGQHYLLYRKIMGHWKQLFPEKILDVNYEDVVSDPEQQLRRVIEFCGLPWDDSCLDENQKQHVSQTASKWQARQPVYKSSVRRWKKYEKHLGPLLEVLAPMMDESDM